MSEKRRPDKVIVAEKQGKAKWVKARIELFSQTQWGHESRDHCQRPKYRVRMNGKWVTAKRYWSISEITAQLRQWMTR